MRLTTMVNHPSTDSTRPSTSSANSDSNMDIHSPNSMQEESQDKVFDLLGCGFGPANLAIAVALAERWAEEKGEKQTVQTAIFVEKYSEFSWHPGMLIPGAQMQISCLKDLAMLRNPNSKYTFLSYLHSQGRLLHFINRGSMIPPRREFADYLAWAADKVQADGIQVAYAEEVVAVNKTTKDAGGVYVFKVTSRRTSDDRLITRFSRNIVISPGGTPRLPPCLSFACFKDSQGRVVHTSSYMTRIDSLISTLSRQPSALKLAIIGSGQSASEVLLDLHARLQGLPTGDNDLRHELHLIMRSGSFKPSDDSPFVNEIFNPEATGHIFDQPSSEARKSIIAEYRNTNYGVISSRTMDAVYEIIYEQNLSDGIASRTTKPVANAPPRVVLHKYRTVTTAEVQDAHRGITLTTRHVHTSGTSIDSYDAVICGTGYDRTSWQRLLSASNFANDYGLADDSAMLSRKIMLSTASEEYSHYDFVDDAHGGLGYHSPERSGSAEGSESSLSTPPSSEDLPLTSERVPVIRISRRYRLLPSVPGEERAKAVGRNRVYLQGCEEATHGLSDSLLSVLGVRAGEIVDDLYESG